MEPNVSVAYNSFPLRVHYFPRDPITRPSASRGSSRRLIIQSLPIFNGSPFEFCYARCSPSCFLSFFAYRTMDRPTDRVIERIGSALRLTYTTAAAEESASGSVA